MAFAIAHSLEEWRALWGHDSLPREVAGGATNNSLDAWPENVRSDAWRDPQREPPRSVVTIGNFDGVHLGHQAILRAMVEHAQEQHALATVVTFDPHPLCVLKPEYAPPMLMTLAQRLRCFADLGLDAALVLKFVRRILVGTLAVKAVLLGETFRFGYRHAGDVKLLTELGRAAAASSNDDPSHADKGFQVMPVQPVVYRGEIVSSTLVRQALRAGAVSRAARLLGKPYELEGFVQRGQGIGRKLIVPTLNLATKAEILPAHGVYATETCVGTRHGGKWYRGVTNIGIRPTVSSGNSGTADPAPNATSTGTGAVGGNAVPGEYPAASGAVPPNIEPNRNNVAQVSVESYLFDFDDEVTSGPLAVRFCIRLRDERKFPGIDALRNQILRDAARAQRFFRRLRNRELSI